MASLPHSRTVPHEERLIMPEVRDATEEVVNREIRMAPPQLVIEVLSPANSRRERAEELADYAEPGVPEVWIVSREARTVEVPHLENAQYTRAQILAAGDLLKPRIVPHVQVDIARIWPD